MTEGFAVYAHDLSPELKLKPTNNSFSLISGVTFRCSYAKVQMKHFTATWCSIFTVSYVTVLQNG